MKQKLNTHSFTMVVDGAKSATVLLTAMQAGGVLRPYIGRLVQDTGDVAITEQLVSAAAAAVALTASAELLEACSPSEARNFAIATANSGINALCSLLGISRGQLDATADLVAKYMEEHAASMLVAHDGKSVS